MINGPLYTYFFDLISKDENNRFFMDGRQRDMSVIVYYNPSTKIFTNYITQEEDNEESIQTSFKTVARHMKNFEERVELMDTEYLRDLKLKQLGL